MIHVSHLYKSYGTVRALRDVSFDVAEGQVVAFLGPNGAGKTTALRILTGFLPGDRGTVTVNGHDVQRQAAAVRRSIGYLPEGVPLYPEMRVEEYLRFRARLKGIARRDRKHEIGQSLDRVGITDVRARIVGTLSKGYRQRVGLADALLGQPRVLILDEPTVGLDPGQVIQFRQLLRDVGRERTVLLSTHILGEAELVCDDTIIIHRGEIVAHDSAATLRERVRAISPVVVELVGEAPRAREALEELEAVDRVEEIPRGAAAGEARVRAYRLWPLGERDPREAVFVLASERGWTLRELHREDVTLEQIFLQVVGRKDAPAVETAGAASPGATT